MVKLTPTKSKNVRPLTVKVNKAAKRPIKAGLGAAAIQEENVLLRALALDLYREHLGERSEGTLVELMKRAGDALLDKGPNKIEDCDAEEDDQE